MWKYNSMIALVLLTAGVYMLLLIPFKSVTLIPGFAEIRPASLIPVVSGLLFGPAGAWGSAIGNLAGDMFGTLSAGSVFGFFGNFLYSFLAYKLWSTLGGRSSDIRPPLVNSARKLLHFEAVSLIASTACAVFIAWGIDLLKLVPFISLSIAITLNNIAVCLVLGPILLPLLYRQTKSKGLYWLDLMDKREVSKPNPNRLFPVMVCIGALGALAAGTFLSALFAGQSLHLQAVLSAGSGSLYVSLGVLPFLGVMLFGIVNL